jgi:hypothetical protein
VHSRTWRNQGTAKSKNEEAKFNPLHEGIDNFRAEGIKPQWTGPTDQSGQKILNTN